MNSSYIFGERINSTLIGLDGGDEGEERHKDDSPVSGLATGGIVERNKFGEGQGKDLVLLGLVEFEILKSSRREIK